MSVRLGAAVGAANNFVAPPGMQYWLLSVGKQIGFLEQTPFACGPEEPYDARWLQERVSGKSKHSTLVSHCVPAKQTPSLNSQMQVAAFQMPYSSISSPRWSATFAGTHSPRMDL